VIVLDTHIWVWWVHGDSRLSSSHAKLIEDNEDDENGVGTIWLWEVAKLVELGRLVLPVALDDSGSMWYHRLCAKTMMGRAVQSKV